MASFDESGQLIKVITYFVILIISIRFLIFVFRWAKPRIFAYLLTIFSSMSNKSGGHMKQELFSLLKEQKSTPKNPLKVLEVGAGTGTNFKFFPKDSQVIALDPNVHCMNYLEKNASTFGEIQLIRTIIGTIEDMAQTVKSESVDAVVCTYVLCSVDEMDTALKEIKRVLKPNGQFYFLEHVKDHNHNSWTHIGQRLAYPFLKFFADCNCVKDTWTYINRAGFSALTYRQIPGPKKFPFFIRPHLFGHATK